MRFKESYETILSLSLFCKRMIINELRFKLPLWVALLSSVTTISAQTVPDANAPLDGIAAPKTQLEKQVLPYEPVREADIGWEKRIWRVLDVREKMNLPFAYPDAPFFEILLKGIQDSVLKAYSVEDDKFHHRLSAKEVMDLGRNVDTVPVFDPITYDGRIRCIMYNKFDPESIKRFRIKEIWYFDKAAAVLKVRILGIAPLRDKTDDQGNFLYEEPLFWVYYPDCRQYLAKHRAFTGNNDANPISWEDMFEQRRFSSYIFKESNAYDRRLQAYLTGVDVLLEADKIKQDVFNYEHDFWGF
jgi:gliding motility associated protien GldN